MKNAITKGRIKEQIKLLKELEKKFPKLKFDMGDFGSHSADHPPAEKNYCGTVACQLGTAALHKPFRDQGLIGLWDIESSYAEKYNPRTKKVEQDTKYSDGELRITFFGKHMDQYEIGAKFFGISHKLSEFMFGSGLENRQNCINAWEELLEVGEKKFIEQNEV